MPETIKSNPTKEEKSSFPPISFVSSSPAVEPKKPRLELVDDSILSRAMRSIVAERSHTIVDVLHHRAFRHYAEGLRQYLAIRLKSVSAAERAIRKLRAVVASKQSDDLVQPPGLRAHLYSLARGLSLEPQGDGELLPWRAVRDNKQALRIQRLREHLVVEDAELLELRYARELNPQEIAFVIGAPVEGVLEALQDATQKAAQLVRKRNGDSLRRLILQAFALETSTPTIRNIEDRLEVISLSPGALVGGRYRIETRVGTGAFGDVYRARDDDVPGHVVALKMLHEPAYSDESRQAALRELRHIASVFHPSVVHLKDHGWYEGRLWFVMPWYEGETLESRLQREPLSRAEARVIFEQLAHALATVHASGIRHQDIKPENVFLVEMPGDEQVLPVLIDFGVAATEAEMLVAGTPTYFAPEVAAQFASVENKPKVGFEADVFALALALRNSLEPSTQDDVPAGAVETFIEERAREVPCPPINHSLRFLRSTFQRWMHIDSLMRPTAEEFAQELSILTLPEERRSRRLRFLRWLIPIVVVLGTALLAAWHHFQLREEATRAQAERQVALVREDLEQTDAERRRIAADADRIRESLEQTRLSREQLEEEFGRIQEQKHTLQRQLDITRSEIERQREERDEMRARLVERQRALEAEREQVRILSEEKVAERTHARALEHNLRQIEVQHRELERAKGELESEIAQHESLARQERARRIAADARADALENELAETLRALHALRRASEEQGPPEEQIETEPTH